MDITRVDTEHFTARHEDGAYTLTGVSYAGRRLMLIKSMRGPRKRLFMSAGQLIDTLKALHHDVQVLQSVM